jgi:hypothetical protein
MELTDRLAKHAHEVFFGNNWTSSNLKEHLSDVTWEQAVTKVRTLNTIASLVYHINYYVSQLVKMLHGAPLEAIDMLSFELPPIECSSDWKQLLEKNWADADDLVQTIKGIPESRLWEYLGEEKYGDFYYNILGIIEHTHYHLGQIVLIKKLLNPNGTPA